MLEHLYTRAMPALTSLYTLLQRLSYQEHGVIYRQQVCWTFNNYIIEVKLTYEPVSVRLSVGRSVGLSVIISLKGRN